MVTVPLKGAVAAPNAGASGRAFIMGSGGFIRRSDDGGQTWATQTVGEPWRSWDINFFDDGSGGLNGWMVSQFFRLENSIDGGKTWAQRSPPPNMNRTNLRAVAFASRSDTENGVIVGDPDPTTDPPGLPKILWTDFHGFPSWKVPTNVIYTDGGNGFVGASLNDVDWADSNNVWAVGEGGLILHSVKDVAQGIEAGDIWNQYPFPPPTATPPFYTIQGVSFRDATTGIVVGYRSAASGTAFAYQILGPSLTCTEIPISDPSVFTLTDVDISGNTAYAVGDRQVGNVRDGVLLRSTYSGGSFSSFVVIRSAPEPDMREDGERHDTILKRVAILPNGDVFAGGECGRVWQLSGTTWTEHKSQTSADIQGMSFPLSTVGYVLGKRADLSATSHCLTKYQVP